MDKKDKERILIFAKEGFKKFYDEHPHFLSKQEYKPGKKTYRNLLSLNKMMDLFTGTQEDYISKADVIDKTGWDGSSAYVQHERIITNFGLSDTSWRDITRPVLLLSDKGKILRGKYVEYKEKDASVDLMNMSELPDFAVEYIINELKETTSLNMTLWKNIIFTSLFLYCELGYLQSYSEASPNITEEERRAFIRCCNYIHNGEIMDLTYFQQPIAMLRNLALIDNEKQLTDAGYELLRDLNILKEVDSSIEDYAEVFEEELDEVEEVLDSRVHLELVEPPERKNRPSVVTHTSNKKGKNRNFDKEAKEHKLTGDLGERLVLEYERQKLRNASISDVEEKVFLTSSKKEKYGNAYPCDIISYDIETGEEIFIEVKTTKGGAEAPFFISAEEVSFSAENSDRYKLYRVFNALSKTGKTFFYETTGSVEDNFSLESDRYIATRYKKVVNGRHFCLGEIEL